MTRMPKWDVSSLTPRQRQIHDSVVSGPRGSLEGPLAAWLASPEFADRAQSLGLFCRFESSYPPQLSELAILTVAAHWKSEFEWHAHAPIALGAGLSPTIVEAIRTGEKPSLDPSAAAVYAFATELLRHQQVSEATFNDLRTRFGAAGVADLVGILGYYNLIAMTIAAYEIPAPTGRSAAFIRSGEASASHAPPP
jgi:4-carboxymuconolactone decarboxylase